MESENPDIQWALDLIKPDPSIQPTVIQKYYFQAPLFTLLPGFLCYINRRKGLPLFARPYLFPLTMAIGYAFSLKVEKLYYSRATRRDTVMREYIIRHPEDFPPPERKKYGELFTKWTPIR